MEACTSSCCLISCAFAPGARVKHAACGGRLWHTPVVAAAATAHPFCWRVADAGAAPVGSDDEEEGWDTQVTCAPAFVTVDQSNPHYSAFSIDVRLQLTGCCVLHGANTPTCTKLDHSTLHVLPAADRGLTLVPCCEVLF